MAQVGSLIIYDDNGKIWAVFPDAEGNVLPHEKPIGLPYIETAFGELNGKRALSVDVANGTLVTEDIIIPLTPDQQKIVDLENILLESEGLI